MAQAPARFIAMAAIAAGAATAAHAQITVYQSSFEAGHGGWVGTGDWERGMPASTPALGSCEGNTYSGPPSAFDGDFVWATGATSCYSNCSCDMTLSRTFDLTGAVNPTLRYHWWKDVNGSFDYTQVHVVATGSPLDLSSGTSTTAVLQQADSSTSTGWAEQIIDLSAFEGQIVDVVFSLHSSAVLNHPGWYIDNVRILGDLAPNPGDLQIAIEDAPDPVGNIGDPITYSVTVTNADPNPVANVTVTTSLDAATNYLSATQGVHDGSGAGGVHTATFASLSALSVTTFEVVAATTAAGVVTATTSIASPSVTDPDTSNNVASAATEVTLLTDLAVAIDGAPDPITVSGGDLTYTVEVTNNGPLDAHNAILTVELPSLASFISATAGMHDGFALGGTHTVMYPLIPSGATESVTITAATNGNGEYTALAAVRADEGDIVTGNNSAAATTTVDVSADISVALTDLVDPMVTVGSANTYTLSVTNSGPSAAMNVEWFLNLPFEMTFSSSSAGAHGGSSAGGTVSGTVTHLPAGATEAITVDVTANMLSDSALASASAHTFDPGDPDASNNDTNTTTRIVADAAGFAQVLLSDSDGFPGLPTTAAPNLPGRNITRIERPFLSPDGRKWTVVANLDGDVADDDVVVVWDGAHFVTPLQEGVTMMPDVSDLAGVIDPEIDINDSGTVAFVTSTNGLIAANEVVAKIDLGGNVSVIAREGEVVPGTSVRYGRSMNSVQIDNAGNVYFQAETDGAPGMNHAIIRSDGMTATVLFQEGVTVPAGQDGGEMFPWDGFDAGQFLVTGDALHTLLRGDTENPLSDFDDVLAYDNTVVTQEGVTNVTLFGTPAVTPGYQIFLADNGDWYTIGVNALPAIEDWILRNGEDLLALEDVDEIYIGAGEFWVSLTHIVGDTRGNYVIGGRSDTSDFDFSDVMVVNGESLIARVGDPIDVNGNGIFDDGARIGDFRNQNAIITADGRLLMSMNTVGGAGSGEALVSFDLGLTPVPACPCELDGNDAQVNVFDLLAYLDLWFVSDATADIDGAPGVDVFDLLFFLDCWFPASAGASCP